MSQFPNAFVAFKPRHMFFLALNRLRSDPFPREAVQGSDSNFFFFFALCLTQAYAHFVSSSHRPSRTSIPPKAHSLQRDTVQRKGERYCSASHTLRKRKTGISNMLSHCISTLPPRGAVDGSCFAVYTSPAVSGVMHVLFLECTAMIIIPKQNIMPVRCQMVWGSDMTLKGK